VFDSCVEVCTSALIAVHLGLINRKILGG
jgi:hypothetical protein